MAIKICLDAGHYGVYNQSPAVKSYYESNFAWNFHLLLKKYLEEYGIIVVITRADKNKDLDLVKRGQVAKGCNLFISLHSNAVGSYADDVTDYPLACCCVNGKADTIGLKLAQCVATTMGTKQAARTLHKRYNTGSSLDWYGVLRGAVSVGVPAVLLEHSFHTNTTATNWLLKASNIDKLAKAEAKVIADYYGVKKPVVTTTSTTTTATSLNAGTKLALKNVALYGSSSTATKSGTKTGTYYVWSKEVINNRIRITNSISNVGKSGQVTGWINVTDAKNSVNTSATSNIVPITSYKVKVTTDVLNIRAGAGSNYKITGSIKDKGVYTIIDEANGKGATKWLKLKSGVGWIASDYTKKI